jgi:serine/threonine protein kinase
VGTEEYISPEILQGEDQTSNLDWWTLGILIYEMLYGTTPFKGDNRDATFGNVMFSKVTFPETPLNTISTQCKHLIKRLLIKNPQKRLGSRAGAADIKSHAFFSTVQWALLRNTKPPMIPKLSSPLDGSCFRKMRDSTSFDFAHEATIDTLDDNFSGFESMTIKHFEF